MKKVLLIAYYWPPAGGIAVRRWLGLANAWAEDGVEVHVLTIDPECAEYLQSDASLLSEVNGNIRVHHVRAFNPFVWVKRLFPKSIPGAAFSEDKSSGFKGRLLTVVRSHLFIPDPRRTWVRKAIRHGGELIRSHAITTVVTTSPPPSVHLIGQGIKALHPEVQWLADFRDPWTDIFYYDRLGHSPVSRAIDRAMERKVLERADLVSTVSWGFRDLLSEKLSAVHQGKFHVLTNGMDFEPAERQAAPSAEGLIRIVYTGTLAPSYAVEPVLDALTAISQLPNQKDVVLDFYGAISGEYQQALQSAYPFIQFHGFVEQKVVREAQQQADVLFLLGPDVTKSTGHIPGKLFEYLGAMRPIAFLGHPSDDVTRILEETGAGVCLPRTDNGAILSNLEKLMTGSDAAEASTGIDPEALAPYVRRNQAKQLLEILG